MDISDDRGHCGAIQRIGEDRPFGIALKKHEYADSGVRVLGIEDVLPNQLESGQRKFIPERKFQELTQYLVSPGDLLVTNMGTVGRACVVPETLERSIISSHLIKVTLNSSVAFPRYISWVINSCPSVVAQIRSKCHGAIMAGFNSTLLKELRIPLPPLPEQRRIAAILDKADELRAKRRAALEQLKGLTQAVFFEMFGDPVANPSGHPQRRLVDLVDSERGISYGIVQRGDDVIDGVPVVRIGDLANGEIATGKLKKTAVHIADKYRRTVLRGGELVISIRGTVGRCARVPSELATGNISRELALIPLLNSEPADFVLAMLSTESAQRRISGDMKGIAQRGVNLEDLRELPVIQPPKQAVDGFRAVLDAIRKGRALHNISATAMDDLFRAVQHQAFSGAL